MYDEDIVFCFEVFEWFDVVWYGFVEGFDGDVRSRGGMNMDVVLDFVGCGES